jgi:hypothetical protein
VRDLLLAIETTDLIESVDGWGETTMNAENLIIDDSREGQIIKDLCAVAPYVDRTILSQALIVEAIDLGDLSAFMITSNQGDSFWVSHLMDLNTLCFIPSKRVEEGRSQLSCFHDLRNLP